MNTNKSWRKDRIYKTMMECHGLPGKVWYGTVAGVRGWWVTPFGNDKTNPQHSHYLGQSYKHAITQIRMDHTRGLLP